jgi:hypothetical protein
MDLVGYAFAPRPELGLQLTFMCILLFVMCRTSCKLQASAAIAAAGCDKPLEQTSCDGSNRSLQLTQRQGSVQARSCSGATPCACMPCRLCSMLMVTVVVVRSAE